MSGKGIVTERIVERHPGKSPMLEEQNDKVIDKIRRYDIPRLARMYCRSHAFKAEMETAAKELRDLSKPSGFAWESRKTGSEDIIECPFEASAFAANMSTPRMPIMKEQDEHLSILMKLIS